MAFGSAMAALSRHISCRLLMRPPVICFMWTALGSVVAHSVGKNEETKRRASVEFRRIGVLVLVAAMFVRGTFCFPVREDCIFSTLLYAGILLCQAWKSHAAGKSFF